jgi:hypothetical protein
VITSDDLAPNTTYNGNIRFLNEAADPTAEVTEEIREEDEEHQIFYNPDGLATIEYLDEDGNGNPLGLEIKFVTLAVGAGNLTITLLHEPDKSASGVSEGNMDNAGGESDVLVVFPLAIVE